MPVCDAHGALWHTDKEMPAGDGYLLAASYMQNSVVQDKLLDRDMPMMETVGMSREQYRRQLESIQGVTPWLLCEECVASLNLSSADKEAARETAQRWWKDNSVPGIVPGQAKTRPKRRKEAPKRDVLSSGEVKTSRRERAAGFHRKPEANLYTVLLLAAFLALVIGTVVLYFDTAEYGPTPPGEPTVQTGFYQPSPAPLLAGASTVAARFKELNHG